MNSEDVRLPWSHVPDPRVRDDEPPWHQPAAYRALVLDEA